jgi:hypothetical protein
MPIVVPAQHRRRLARLSRVPSKGDLDARAALRQDRVRAFLCDALILAAE